jgi:hypothetical protein
MMHLGKFDAVKIDLMDFDWVSVQQDRNWWWQMQALPFLNWFVDCYDILTDSERELLGKFCFTALQGWWLKASKSESPLVWHDHAAAFRVRNIVNFIVFCDMRGFEVAYHCAHLPLWDIILEHLAWLADEKNYSRHTNHGFDQAMIAFTIGLMFDGDEFLVHRDINRKRLREEIEYAFTEEGVHVENSPGYQMFMLGRLRQLATLKCFNEQEWGFGEGLVGKAEAFASVITLPNGLLPMIGDTGGVEKGPSILQDGNIVCHDYARSGYVIVRGKCIDGEDFHFIFKNSHFSSYHRHDDDLSIHLYYGGNVLLGDAGIGHYDEKDKRRIRLRSAESHNVPYLNSGAERIPDRLLHAGFMEVNSSSIYASSYCYGSEISRRVCFESIAAGIIRVQDVFWPCGKLQPGVNFFTPLDIASDHAGVSLLAGKCERVAKISTTDSMAVNYGKQGSAYISYKYGEYQEASSFGWMLQSGCSLTSIIEFGPAIVLM